MDVIKISDSNIIIVLSSEDMKKYSIDCNGGHFFDAAARSGLKRIIYDVAGADPYLIARRLKVRVFFSKEGGCEMFVSGLSSDAASGQRHYLHIDPNHIYRFGALEDLLCACRELYSVRWEGESTAFAEIGRSTKAFFLELCGNEAPQLCEFGAKHINSKKGAGCYLSEHCEIICGDAVNILGKFA